MCFSQNEVRLLVQLLFPEAYVIDALTWSKKPIETALDELKSKFDDVQL